MPEKIIKYFLACALIFISFLGFFTCIAYYFFIADWSGNMMSKWMNVGIMICVIATSIFIYALADKIKSKI